MKKEKNIQLSFEDFLFPRNEDSSVEEKVIYNGVPVSQATFKAGLKTDVHRWFRLTPSFGPDLVRDMFSTLEGNQESVVLDPFAGAGTTIIECQLAGITSIGIEINPFLQFVGETCLNWNHELTTLTRVFEQICDDFSQANRLIEFENLELHGLEIPPIHNPTRWWRPDVLVDLLVLKSSINKLAHRSSVRDFFLLALAAALVPDLTNVTLGRLQLHFINRDEHEIEVLPTFISFVQNMIDDLQTIHAMGLQQTSRIILGDSTKITDLGLKRSVDCVITSPPYPNRYSYVWNTRPHLYFFDYFSNPKQASELDKATIGGTWGSATSVLTKGVIEPEFPIIQDIISPIVEEIRSADNLMANYAMKYFNFIARQIMSMEPFLSQDARVAYVVGCSRLKGVFVETDVLLGKIFEGLGLGYQVSSIDRIRRRNSGKDLHESIVYAWKK